MDNNKPLEADPPCCPEWERYCRIFDWTRVPNTKLFRNPALLINIDDVRAVLIRFCPWCGSERLGTFASGDYLLDEDGRMPGEEWDPDDYEPKYRS